MQITYWTHLRIYCLFILSCRVYFVSTTPGTTRTINDRLGRNVVQVIMLNGIMGFEHGTGGVRVAAAVCFVISYYIILSNLDCNSVLWIPYHACLCAFVQSVRAILASICICIPAYIILYCAGNLKIFSPEFLFSIVIDRDIGSRAINMGNALRVAESQIDAILSYNW